MGYTHYWKITERLDKDWDKWTSFLPDAMKIISHASQRLDIALADSLGETKGEATVSLGGVSMNGYAEESHESFVLRSDETQFDFCKTARKPYDRVVVAILILATEYFGNDIEVTSDGDRADLLDGYYMFRSAMCREPHVTIEDHKITAWQQSPKIFEVYVKRTEYGLVEVEAETPEQAKAKADEYVIEGMTKWGACFETYWTENEDEPQLTEIGNEK